MAWSINRSVKFLLVPGRSFRVGSQPCLSAAVSRGGVSGPAQRSEREGLLSSALSMELSLTAGGWVAGRGVLQVWCRAESKQ